jgi:hypothetical protein
MIIAHLSAESADCPSWFIWAAVCVVLVVIIWHYRKVHAHAYNDFVKNWDETGRMVFK